MNNLDLIKRRFAANLSGYNKFATVQDTICLEVSEQIERLGIACPDCCLELGAGTGFLTRRLTALFPRAEFVVNDLVEESEEYLEPYLSTVQHHYIWGDAERIVFPTKLDLVASCSAMQWFVDPAAFVAKVAEYLKPGGYFVFSSFGEENFVEIKQTTGDSLVYVPRSGWESLLKESGFEVLHSLEYKKQLRFDTPRAVLKHISNTGVNGLRRVAWTKTKLLAFEKAYLAAYPFGSGVSLTYHPVIVIGRKSD